jgi:hypothetical protein
MLFYLIRSNPRLSESSAFYLHYVSPPRGRGGSEWGWEWGNIPFMRACYGSPDPDMVPAQAPEPFSSAISEDCQHILLFIERFTNRID